jgi:acyl-coenzyme A thioesterase PaaI-like protein
MLGAMSPRDDEPLDGRLFGDDQPCFGCGPRHPHGLRLAFERDGEEVVTRFVPGADRQGPPGIMHGGLVATAADELADWALIAILGKFGFTASFEARYAAPVRIGRVVEGRARIVKNAGRIADVEARLTQDGALAFTGRFRFALFDRGGAERLLGGPLPEEWLRFCR